MRGLERMEIRGGRYLLLGEVLGHSALGAQPAQAAYGDADELLELPTLLQRPAGQGPCASLRGCCINPATALLLSHRRPAQRRSVQAAAAEAGSLGRGRGRLGEEPGSQESWSRSAPPRCRSQDADRVGSQVCCSRPQGRVSGGQIAATAGGKKPGKAAVAGAKAAAAAAGQKGATAGDKNLGKAAREDKNPRRRKQKAAAAGLKSHGAQKPSGAKSLGGGEKVAAGKSHGDEGKNPWRRVQKPAAAKSRGGGGKKTRRRGDKNPRRRGSKSRGGKSRGVAGAKSCGCRAK
ncbi:uncharacterized protein LOC115834384 [Nomascus leucogenys]|uniref:uncharacterized protein LOC115834384 n=1 Tax=Nomascus leucogenys TaxID=61853 RepID=UPI00122D9DD5|nr:uncharacterized protein LOC115834384 [Nomascus leucogenys]